MTAEVPTTPVAEPAQAATAPTANPEKPEPNWRDAYVGLQRTVNKLHARNDDLLKQNSELASGVGALKDDVDVILKQTVGEDEFGKRVATRAVAQERQAALNAAQAGQFFIQEQTGMFLNAIKAAGVDPNDPTIDWARDAGNVQEWRARVEPSIIARIQRANEDRVKAHEVSLSAKTKKEVEAEAQAMTEENLKAAGVDKIDTAKGSGKPSFSSRVRDAAYRDSPQFLKDLSDAKAGRLKT